MSPQNDIATCACGHGEDDHRRNGACMSLINADTAVSSICPCNAFTERAAIPDTDPDAGAWALWEFYARGHHHEFERWESMTDERRQWWRSSAQEIAAVGVLAEPSDTEPPDNEIRIEDARVALTDIVGDAWRDWSDEAVGAAAFVLNAERQRVGALLDSGALLAARAVQHQEAK